MPPRIPTEEDFASLKTTLPHTLHSPSPPESTTTFLILFHGLGDHEVPFGDFGKNLNLPGVFSISVRGTAPLPAGLLPDGTDPSRHSHWGDDLTIDSRTGELDEDPGFEKAERLIMDKLIKETLIEKCGWGMSDILFFGFGQGGSLALGLASKLRQAERVVDVTEGESKKPANAFKGVLSIGGPLPQSMISTISTRQKSKTSVLIWQLNEDQTDTVKEEFENVKVVPWKGRDISMPRDKDDVLPLMQFFADRLKSEW